MAHLVLTLAQYADGMPPDAVEGTKKATVIALEAVYPRSGVEDEEKKDDFHVSLRPRQVHLLVAGPKRMVGDMRGIDRPEWEKQWSYGEVLFGEIVRSVGLERFSPNGGTQLMANLLDVGDSRMGSSTDNFDREVSLLQDIGLLCLSTLKLKECPSVQRTTIVLPVNATDFGGAADSRKMEVMERVKGVLSRCWDDDQGPLRGTEIEFIVVES